MGGGYIPAGGSSIGPDTDLEVNSVNAADTITAGGGSSAPTSTSDHFKAVDNPDAPTRGFTADKEAVTLGDTVAGTGVQFSPEGLAKVSRAGTYEDIMVPTDVPIIQVVQDLISTVANVRLELTDTAKGDSISLIGTGKGQPVISCWNATMAALELVSMATPATLANTALDLDSTALVAGTTPYALYLNIDGTIVAKKWTNATTRAVALADWHGFKVYDLTDAGKQRRYIGDVLPYHHWTVEAAYNAATNYEAGASCTSGGHTYISLHANNLNNAPPSASHWQDCGAAYDNRGVFCRQTNLQLILNAYNPENLTFGVVNPYTAATSEALTNTAAFQVAMKDAQNNTIWKAECLCSGKAKTSISIDGIGGSASAVFAAVGVDSMTTPHINSPRVENGTLGFQAGVTWNADLAEGYHYIVPLVATVANPRTAYYYALNGTLISCLFQFLGTWRG